MKNKNDKFTRNETKRIITLAEKMSIGALEGTNKALDDSNELPKIKKKAAEIFVYNFSQELLRGRAQRIIFGKNEETTTVKKTKRKYKQERAE